MVPSDAKRAHMTSTIGESDKTNKRARHVSCKKRYNIVVASTMPRSVHRLSASTEYGDVGDPGPRDRDLWDTARAP